ncbi:MAG: GHMP kinase [Acidobacteriota bacterium]
MLITQTPLRVSFAGGGTDLREFYEREEGAVLSTTIDKYIFVLVKERYDRKIVLSWTHKEIVERIDDIKHELIREGMRLVGVPSGIEIMTTADIPSEGSGLGSSSSVTVGLLNAFHTYTGEQVSAGQLAEEACRIETAILKKPIGKQDQYIAAYGGFRRFVFHSDGSVTTTRLDMTEDTKRRLQAHCLLFYTNRTRSAAEVLVEQKRNTSTNLSILRAMREQVQELGKCLESGMVSEVGNLLHEGWCLKRRLARQISDVELDGMYQRAREAGATGGKVLGAGGGGFMLLFCPVEKQENVRKAMARYKEMPFRFESEGTRVIFNIKRETWKI